MTNAKIIREALKFAASNKFEHGAAGSALMSVLEYATDAELIGLAQIIGNANAAIGCLDIPAPAMDSAELARNNID